MKLLCAPADVGRLNEQGALRVILFGQAGADDRGSAGAAVRNEIRRERLAPARRAWDLLSIAMSIMAADAAGLRTESPDGWTREFELEIAVAEPAFWNGLAGLLADALAFLTTDRWQFHFIAGGRTPVPPERIVRPPENAVVLLSGGLDSLSGAIDLGADGDRLVAISKIVRGDAEKQLHFASLIGGGLKHFQLNDNAVVPGVEDTSQRARSIIFLAFGVLVATALKPYRPGGDLPLYICENGFIAVNPPLTGSRIGSLSTRTAHPYFLAQFQSILNAANLGVRIRTPYAAKTKGEMLKECEDQPLLRRLAASSTSCGRFQRYNYHHCGRCVPCQVRRAAFLAWGRADSTEYVFEELGRDDPDHAGFDDVRSVGMALAAAKDGGFDAWLGSALSWRGLDEREALKDMLRRGLAELGALHAKHGVK
ncbi:MULTISPECIES: Qat anti-phage system QueC-like protein QatC [unclassified Bradyrhizobium]|uniref:Qat anti-phage system QueC-like protein QatC n=1 Tax=unclassified Bradyrhizobium TaxID=2631580 RepID=UPI001CD4D3A9|nr:MULTISPECIES: Qat anti-phage system QueC-like protein QatC [unclassified Bradyrhizobium]MCA1386066.1 7-cyano-7-deazaguanine synthase [Bradyrhizobium sp. BRP05]MCA1393864.1 7-cyano-7-deazaguanine synthase [Bradyrhizobium sp. IC3123]MCA1423508.1 7-cyano-7-deazaguanine synthase [Bradyrhizobium sp. BRP23]MCA1430598.1 7-cyano-7-deazaguanine synthase [Bradyrhizobium sp. NBAIM16]MCA1480109.1 7-cyano-7-deazaguanine synthase [Bradyrhizobium sp. NBAIM08]